MSTVRAVFCTASELSHSTHPCPSDQPKLKIRLSQECRHSNPRRLSTSTSDANHCSRHCLNRPGNQSQQQPAPIEGKNRNARNKDLHLRVSSQHQTDTTTSPHRTVLYSRAACKHLHVTAPIQSPQQTPRPAVDPTYPSRQGCRLTPSFPTAFSLPTFPTPDPIQASNTLRLPRVASLTDLAFIFLESCWHPLPE